MPILPIDLQTLFTQMNQVGKEQLAQKEGAAIQSSMVNMGLLKQAEEKNASVSESQNIGEAISSLKNEEKKKRGNRGKKEKSGQPAEKNKEVFSDPALGHHIDIKS